MLQDEQRPRCMKNSNDAFGGTATTLYEEQRQRYLRKSDHAVTANQQRIVRSTRMHKIHGIEV